MIGKELKTLMTLISVDEDRGRSSGSVTAGRRPRGRAVDGGGLVHVPGDALQAGQDRVGGERQRYEDRHAHHPGQRACRVAQPVGLIGAELLDHAEVVQDHVDDADVRVERPLEDQRGHHHGGGPGGDERPPGDPAAGEPLVEELGEAERDQHGHGDHDHDPDQGTQQDPGRFGLVEQAGVVPGAVVAGRRTLRRRSAGMTTAP